MPKGECIYIVIIILGKVRVLSVCVITCTRIYIQMYTQCVHVQDDSYTETQELSMHNASSVQC